MKKSQGQSEMAANGVNEQDTSAIEQRKPTKRLAKIRRVLKWGTLAGIVVYLIYAKFLGFGFEKPLLVLRLLYIALPLGIITLLSIYFYEKTIAKIALGLNILIFISFVLLMMHLMGMDYRHYLTIKNDSKNDFIIQKIIVNNDILFEGEYFIPDIKSKNNIFYSNSIRNWKRKEKNILHINIKYEGGDRDEVINLIDERDRGCGFVVLYKEDGYFSYTCRDIYRVLDGIEKYPWWVGM